MRAWWFLLPVTVACASAPPPAASTVRQMPEPEHIPLVARQLLAERMMTHGRDMSDLVWAMLFLDTRSVEEIADDIAAQPRIARPLANDASELASRLPAAFFDLQDQLVEDASRLADEARRDDLEGMTQAYSALTTTCVQCHAAYLQQPPERLTMWKERR